MHFPGLAPTQLAVAVLLLLLGHVAGIPAPVPGTVELEERAGLSSLFGSNRGLVVIGYYTVYLKSVADQINKSKKLPQILAHDFRLGQKSFYLANEPGVEKAGPGFGSGPNVWFCPVMANQKQLQQMPKAWIPDNVEGDAEITKYITFATGGPAQTQPKGGLFQSKAAAAKVDPKGVLRLAPSRPGSSGGSKFDELAIPWPLGGKLKLQSPYCRERGELTTSSPTLSYRAGDFLKGLIGAPPKSKKKVSFTDPISKDADPSGNAEPAS